MIPAAMSIFVATYAIDMRRAFDGLAEAARTMLEKDPKSGALFVFYNGIRPANRVADALSGRAYALCG